MNRTDTEPQAEDTGDNVADDYFYDPDRQCYDLPDGTWIPQPPNDFR